MFTSRIYQTIIVGLIIALIALFGLLILSRLAVANTKVELASAKSINTELSASIEISNASIAVLNKQRLDASIRLDLAEKLAAAKYAKLNATMVKLSGVKAATCKDAMPYVDLAIKGSRK